MHDEKDGVKLKCIPLSASTIRRQEHTAEDSNKQLLGRISQCGSFGIQVGETTYVSNTSQLMVFVRLYFDNNIHITFSESLSERCTGVDILSTLNDNKEHVLWKNCQYNRCSNRCLTMKNLLLTDYLVAKIFKKLNLKRSCTFFFYEKTRLRNMLTSSM